VLSPAALREAQAGPVDFARHVKPIFEAKCSMCHNPEALPGKPSLANRAEALRTGALGVWIVPGRPEQSLLLRHIHGSPAHLKAMPPVGEQISPEEIAVLTKWIREGAAWPTGSAGQLKK
jgi:mono/diheme cytochrome c family protein